MVTNKTLLVCGFSVITITVRLSFSVFSFGAVLLSCNASDPQVALVEPLLCKLLYWHFDQITRDFLGENVGVAEVLSDSDIWLLR